MILWDVRHTYGMLDTLLVCFADEEKKEGG